MLRAEIVAKVDAFVAMHAGRTVVCRLKEQWCSEHDDWSKSDLSDKGSRIRRVGYAWA